METVRGSHHIGYKRSEEGSETFQSLNPATGEQLAVQFHEATAAETKEAIRLSEAAFPVYSELSVQERAGFMKAIALEMERNAPQLTHAFMTESGLPPDRAEAELKRTCFQLVSYADAILNGTVLNAVIDTADGNRFPAPKPDLRRVNRGIGPVVVFGASNFPFAYSTMGGDSASALAAGCPVIVKGHAMHPYTGELVAGCVVRVAQQLGMPEGVFSHLHAKSFTVGQQLVSDERIQAVGFTGSFKGGMALHALARERKQPIPVFAEMGSVNPIVVLPKAMELRPDEIASSIAASVALNAGQFCTSPGLLFVIDTAASEAFLRKLTDLMNEVPEQTMLHPAIKKQYEAAKEAQRADAEILSENTDQSLNTIRPAVFSISGEAFIAEENRQEEVFGSFIMVVRCAHEEELRAALAVLHGQLAAALFADLSESGLASQCLHYLNKKAGRIVMNGVPTGVEVSPAQQHGGPFPATTDSRFTSVGNSAIARFMRPVAYQNFPDEWLPEPLKAQNPLNILRFVNGLWTRDPC